MASIALAPIIQKIAKYVKEKKEKEGFSETEDTVEPTKTWVLDPIVTIAFSVINLVLICIALFMYFRRNPEFDLLPFLAALCYSPCYIVYALAVPIQPRATPQMITGGRGRLRF